MLAAERGRVDGQAARGSGLEDDPAGEAAGGLRGERLGCFRERVYRADLGPQVPLVDQSGEFDQLSAVGLLDEDHLTDVVPAGRWLRGGLDRDQRSSGPEQCGRAGEHLAADGVHDQVGLACRVLDTAVVQRDEPVGAQPGDQRRG